LDDPGRVRSQIASIVCQIQRFDFEGNLVRGSDAKSNNMNTVTFTNKTSIFAADLVSGYLNLGTSLERGTSLIERT
jgi:hypothetical protein